jgi:hypothetical protein
MLKKVSLKKIFSRNLPDHVSKQTKSQGLIRAIFPSKEPITAQDILDTIEVRFFKFRKKFWRQNFAFYNQNNFFEPLFLEQKFNFFLFFLIF